MSPQRSRRLFRPGDEVEYSVTIAPDGNGRGGAHLSGRATVVRAHGTGYEVRTPTGIFKFFYPGELRQVKAR